MFFNNAVHGAFFSYGAVRFGAVLPNRTAPYEFALVRKKTASHCTVGFSKNKNPHRAASRKINPHRAAPPYYLIQTKFRTAPYNTIFRKKKTRTAPNRTAPEPERLKDAEIGL